ncbi:MAG: type II secretion system protein [Planctomycetota bacterium]
MPQFIPALTVRKQGFTLIELLVVISIIALLVAILLPALSSARQVARTLACGTNQQQIGRATFAYIADSDGYFMKQEDNGGGPKISWDDQLGLGGYDGRVPSQLGNVNFAPAFPNGATALYECPLNDLPAAFTPPNFRNNRDYGFTSYQENFANGQRVNTNLQQGVIRNQFDTSQPLGQRGESRRLDDLTKASDTIVLCDNLSMPFIGADYQQNKLGQWNQGGLLFSGWSYDPRNYAFLALAVPHHARRAEIPASVAVGDYFAPNYLFADGHVKNEVTGNTLKDDNGDFINSGFFNATGTQWDSFR